MNTMKVVEYAHFGIPQDVVTLGKADIPEPSANQIRCKTILSPIHNHDLFIIKGEYGFKPKLPAIPGSEAVAVVDALGAGVSHVKVGDRIAVAGVQGTWAEYFLAPVEVVIPLPEKIPDELAAQLIAMPFSALMLLNELQLKPGEWLVINAANGAIGKLFFQLAKPRQINVAGLVRSEAAKEQLRKLNINAVFDTEDKNWESQLRQAVGTDRIAACVDMVGGSVARQLLALLSERGEFISFGAIFNKILELDTNDLIYKETTVKGFWGSKHFERVTVEELMAISSEIIHLAETGKLQLPIGEIFALEQTAEAVLAATQKKKGKILLKP